MTKTVALYAPAYEAFRSEIDALGLDIDLLTFDAVGQLSRDGAALAVEETAVDYVWLSNFISRDGA